MKKSLIVYSLLLLLIYSCSNHKSKSVDESHNKISLVNIRHAANLNESNMELSQFGNRIIYIPLETTEDNFLSFIYKLIICENNVFVSDRFGLYQFDLDGNFIRKLGQQGNGPGEYNGPISFTVDSKNNDVLVSDNREVLVFDVKSGQFKESFDIAIDVFSFYSLPDNRLAFLTYELPFLEELGVGLAEVLLLDKQGEILDSILNPKRKDILGNAYGYPISYRHENGFFYIYNFSDTIFHINHDFTRQPYMVFNFGNEIEREKLNLSQEFNINQYPNFLSLADIIEDTNYLYLTVRKGITIGPEDVNSRMVLHKATGELTAVSSLKNDIDHGLDFWPRALSEKGLISYYQPYEILEFYNSIKDQSKLSNEFNKMIEILNENSNPVLVILE